MHPLPTPPGRALIWLAAWPVTAVFVLSNAATPLYGVWRREIGFGTGTMTVVFACYIAGLLGALLFTGALSDRIGRRPVLLPALALAAVASVLFAVADTVAVLALARFLTGVAIGAVVSAGMAAVADVAGPERRAQGSLAASTAMVLGAGIGPLLAGAVSETLPGPTTTVFLIELALISLAVVVTVRLPLSRPERSAGPVVTVRIPSVPRASRGRLAAGIAVFAPGITATSFMLSLGPSLLGDLLGATSRTAAGAMAFVMFGTATGVQFAVRGRSVRAILLGGAAATVAAMGLLVLAVQASSAAALVGAAVLAGAGQGLGQLGGLTLLAAQVPGTRLAEANAGLNSGGYLLAGTLPVVAGYVSGAVGLRGGATAFAVVLAGIAVVGMGCCSGGCGRRSLRHIVPRPRAPRGRAGSRRRAAWWGRYGHAGWGGRFRVATPAARACAWSKRGPRRDTADASAVRDRAGRDGGGVAGGGPAQAHRSSASRSVKRRRKGAEATAAHTPAARSRGEETTEVCR